MLLDLTESSYSYTFPKQIKAFLGPCMTSNYQKAYACPPWPP